MKVQSATIKLIAELSGVSRGTVDRVLHKRGKVNPEAAKRVEEIAKSLDYKPNTVAKSLANRKRNIRICVVLHIRGNLFFNDVLKGVEQANKEIRDFGISIGIKFGSNFNVEDQLANIDAAVEEGFKAIILIPINDPRIVQKCNDVSAKGIPLVFLTSYLDGTDYLCHVGCDYYKAGQIAAELIYLISGAQAKIGIITPPLTLLGVNLRLQGLQDTIKSTYTSMRLLDIREVPSDEGLAYARTREMIESYPDMDSLFYSTGGLSGGLQAVKELGLYGKLKMISLDLVKPITDAILDGGIQATVCQEPESQGYKAVKVAFDFLVAHILPERRNILIDPTIKVRHSLLSIEAPV